MEIDLDLLKRTLAIQSIHGDDKEMLDYLFEEFVFLQDKYTDVEWNAAFDEYGNFYVTKGAPAEGAFYPAVVAHIDTVHSRESHMAIMEFSDYADNSTVLYAMNMNKVKQVGIGGDDKVGVYVALHMLEAMPCLKVVFFRDEEVGCKGSSAANLDFFKDCAFVLQADRRGSEDFIRTSGTIKLYSRRFERACRPYMNRHGFKPSDEGLGSDTPTMKRKGLNICVANVSCGYFKPHTHEEFVIVGHVQRTLNLFVDICTNLTAQRWPHIYKPEPFYYGYYDRELRRFMKPGDKGFDKKRAIARQKELDSLGSSYPHSYSEWDQKYPHYSGRSYGTGESLGTESTTNTDTTWKRTVYHNTDDSEVTTYTPSSRPIYEKDEKKEESGALTRQLPLSLGPGAPASGEPIAGNDTGAGEDDDLRYDTTRMIPDRNGTILQQALFRIRVEKLIDKCEVCYQSNILHLPARDIYYCDNCDAVIPYPQVVMVRRPTYVEALAIDMKELDDETALDIYEAMRESPEFGDLSWHRKYIDPEPEDKTGGELDTAQVHDTKVATKVSSETTIH